ncbi:hypothetical protein FG173_22020 [Serratia marcescens]|nr:hypothetical protein FG173_22020 [Serratia marcescens]
MTGRWRLFWEGFNTACAQCYPRLACPLNVSLLMHLHDPARSAPALAQRGKKHTGSSCDFMHLMHAWGI